MAFINQAVTVLQTLVIALGAGLAVWGVGNLMEGYGASRPLYLSLHFRRWLGNPDIFAAHGHTSNGSSYSAYGQSSI